MNDNITSIRFELEVAAQKLISRYMINNEAIEAEIEAGIKAAFTNIDIPKLIESTVSKCIQDAIKSSGEWGKIHAAVKKKTDEIVDSYIQVAIDKFHTNFKD